MPLGTGYLPSGALGTQLGYITRRAILPDAVSQIYNSSATIAGFLANAELEAGGVDSFMVNVQSSQFVLPQWTGFQGSFNAPTAVQGLQQAAWTMCWAVCPIPIFGSEILIQEKQKIQDILSLRLTDAGNAMRDLLGTSLFTWTTGTPTNQIVGLPGAIDDGTVTGTYGGLSRTTFPFWKSTRYNAGGANFSRALALQYITGTAKAQGETPDFGVMNFGTWLQLAQDYIGLERYWPNMDNTNEYISAFRAIDVAGVPFYGDPYCPEGTCYLMNTNYLSMRVHEEAQWEVMDFVPLTPVNQVGWIGVVFIVLLLANTKPKASTVITNFATSTI